MLVRLPCHGLLPCWVFLAEAGIGLIWLLVFGNRCHSGCTVCLRLPIHERRACKVPALPAIVVIQVTEVDKGMP